MSVRSTQHIWYVQIRVFRRERRAGFEPATVRLCRPFPWAARAPTHVGKTLSPTRLRATVGRSESQRVRPNAPPRSAAHASATELGRKQAPILSGKDRRTPCAKCLRALLVSTPIRHNSDIGNHSVHQSCVFDRPEREYEMLLDADSPKLEVAPPRWGDFFA